MSWNRKLSNAFGGSGFKSIRKKLGLTGKQLKKHLGLESSSGVSSSFVGNASSGYKYNSARTLASLTGGV